MRFCNASGDTWTQWQTVLYQWYSQKAWAYNTKLDFKYTVINSFKKNEQVDSGACCEWPKSCLRLKDDFIDGPEKIQSDPFSASSWEAAPVEYVRGFFSFFEATQKNPWFVCLKTKLIRLKMAHNMLLSCVARLLQINTKWIHEWFPKE